MVKTTVEALREEARKGKRFTYADYVTWDIRDENGNPVRVELVDGVPYELNVSYDNDII